MDDGYSTTLGLAYYRAKDCSAALKALEKSENIALLAPATFTRAIVVLCSH